MGPSEKPALSLKMSTERHSTCTRLSLREEAAVRNGIVSFFPSLFHTRPRRVTRRQKVTAREAALFAKRSPSAAACEYCVCFWHLVSSDWRARRSMPPLPPKRQKVPALIAAAAAAARLPVRLSRLNPILSLFSYLHWILLQVLFCSCLVTPKPSRAEPSRAEQRHAGTVAAALRGNNLWLLQKELRLKK